MEFEFQIKLSAGSCATHLLEATPMRKQRKSHVRKSQLPVVTGQEELEDPQ